ncbi:SDR family NAD(P)-dependent oxidoreductase [Phenylobacterium sp.]|uniref:SDR family NAD(P)-dependent oxidoreductase n=1 Tax=Phenylobacterium sp. TaxID=1871053 RepID=UPI00374DF04B
MTFAAYPSLAGRCVFVTGGATGIGASLVEAFHGQGANIAFIDVQAEAGAALAARLPGAIFQACDVTDAPALERAVQAAADRLGGLSVLVNNVANDTRHKAQDTTAEAWRGALAVNLDAAFLAARAAYPFLRVSGGSIVNISSITALLGPPEMAAYAAAKGAVNALTKALAREWGGDNIRVNALSPGWVVTQRQLDLWLTPEAEAEWMTLVALKQRITPEDIARLALFLAADDSRMITGQNLVIDGGRT